jgi:hypothetical protein
MSIGQGGDEAGESTVDGGLSDHSMDRRSLIKKVGIAGAAAWVAPVVIESMISPASAASIPPGVYRLLLSSQHCNPTPVMDPTSAVAPASCAALTTAWNTPSIKSLVNQSQLDSLLIVVQNCQRRYDISVTTTNPKVTFTAAGSGSGNASHVGSCVTPGGDPLPGGKTVTWASNGATNRLGYFLVVTITA